MAELLLAGEEVCTPLAGEDTGVPLRFAMGVVGMAAAVPLQAVVMERDLEPVGCAESDCYCYANDQTMGIGISVLTPLLGRAGRRRQAQPASGEGHALHGLH